MQDFFAWLFSQNNSDLKIGLFDIWHFLYLFLTFGGTLVLALLGRRFPKKRNFLQRLMAYLTVGLYVADFFIMPLSDSYNGIHPFMFKMIRSHYSTSFGKIATKRIKAAI